MNRNARAAALVCLVGAVAYLLMQRLVGVDTLSNWGYAGLAVGAFSSTLIWYDPRERTWLGNLGKSVLIVGVTFMCIGLSIGLTMSSEARLRADTLFAATLGTCFFGLIYAAWWLVPGLMTLLWAINRVAAGAGTKA